MSRAGGGGGGQSAYNNQQVTLQSGTSSATGVDPYIEVEYNSPSGTGTVIKTTTNISGATGSRLRIKRDTVGIHEVQCKVSHPIAVNNPASSSTRENSPIYTDTAEFNALSAVNLTRSNLTYEVCQDNTTSSFSTETVNLFVQPLALTGWSASNNSYRNIMIFPQEENITVKMTMSGSAGQSFNGNKGGEGGETVFTYTLLKDTEYTLKLGVTIEPTASIGRGGAGAYFYEGGRLLVACGGGGASGWNSGSNGGNGGGAGVQGANGTGSNSAGNGGYRIGDGEMPSGGILPSGTQGGKVESCTTGQYWKDQGYAPCAWIGNSEKFRLFNGTVNTNTTSIKRGYKADYDKFGYRHNGRNAPSYAIKNGQFVAGGGSGATGGSAGDLTGGGGGGSGYTNGSVNIVRQRQGGNGNSEAQCLIELLSESPTTAFQILVRGV